MNASLNNFAVSEGSDPRGRARVRSIQPDFTDDMLESDQETVTLGRTLNDLRAVIANWCMVRDDLPDGFADTFGITSAARQVVPSVVIRVQRSSRTLISKLIPFDGTPLSSSRFDASNLFALSQFTGWCEFPDSTKRESKLIPGNEGITVCEDCDGAGETLCVKCYGTGTESCATCRGAGQIACGRCRGQGVVLIEGTETISCPLCSGRRTAACTSCTGKGHNNCPTCQGGTIKCKSCAASGKMRQQWHLVTLTQTYEYHRLICRNGWVDEEHEVAADGVLVRSRDWPHPEQLLAVEMQRLLPDCLAAALKQCLKSVNFSSSSSEQNTGLRCELRASYVYHVETCQKNILSDFFVSGCANNVTPRKVARRKRGLLGRVTDKYTVSREEKEHVRSVNAGKVYLTDTLGLGNEFRRLGTQLNVSDTGYVIPANTHTNTAEIQILFDYDQANQPLVRALIELGSADRHRFPDYMAISQTLSIGMLGLLEKNNRTIERLVLVDSRFYVSMSVTKYYSVVQLLASEAQQLIDSNFRWKPESKKVLNRSLKKICDNIELNLQLIVPNGRLTIVPGRGDALLTFRFSNGRTQVVLLTLKSAPEYDVVELKSRCRIAQSPSTIRAALTHNLVSPCGGFALDISTNPPVIDLVHRVLTVNGEPDYSELIHCLSSVIYRADGIEQKYSSQDQF